MKPAYIFYSLDISGRTNIAVKDIDGIKLFEDNFVSDQIKSISTNIDVIVITMFSCFSIDIPNAFRKDFDFLKKFNHHIIFHGMEPVVKLTEGRYIEGSEYQPVYEFLTVYHNFINPKTLDYVDNDFSIHSSLRKWVRSTKSKPKFKVDNIANLLYGSICLQFTSNFYKNYDNHETFFKNEFQKIRSSYQYTHLYTCFNRQKRWGRELIFYLLWKNNLLNNGIVTMHQSSYSLRFLKICNKLGLSIPEEDFYKINKILPIKIDNITIPDFRINSANNFNSFLSNFYTDEMFMAPINVVTETFFVQDIITYSEKIIRPILLGQIILPIATKNICHTLSEKFNFKFSQSTLEVDNVSDPIERASLVVNKLMIFKNNPKILKEELDFVNDNYNYNLNILLNNINCTVETNIKEIIKKYV